MHRLHIRRRPPQPPLRPRLHQINSQKRHRHREIHNRMAQNIYKAEPHKEWPQKIRLPIETPPILHNHIQGKLARRDIGVVSAFRQREHPLLRGVHLARDDAGRLALVVLGEAVAAVFDEFEDTVLRAFDEGPVQGREALIVSCVHVRAPFEEEVYDGAVAFVGGPHETRVALGICDVDGYVLVQEEGDLEDVSV